MPTSPRFSLPANDPDFCCTEQIEAIRRHLCTLPPTPVHLLAPARTHCAPPLLLQMNSRGFSTNPSPLFMPSPPPFSSIPGLVSAIHLSLPSSIVSPLYQTRPVSTQIGCYLLSSENQKPILSHFPFQQTPISPKAFMYNRIIASNIPCRSYLSQFFDFSLHIFF